jgi:hypothetical protein
MNLLEGRPHHLAALKATGPAGPPAPARPDHLRKCGVTKFCTLTERTPSSSSASSVTANRPPSSRNCSATAPFCKLISCTPGTPASGAKQRSGTDRKRSHWKCGFPCQTTPTLYERTPASLSRHAPTRSASAFR